MLLVWPGRKDEVAQITGWRMCFFELRIKRRHLEKLRFFETDKQKIGCFQEHSKSQLPQKIPPVPQNPAVVTMVIYF